MKKWELEVAVRYLSMAGRRAHTAFLTLISTLGLAVGVATLLISLALLSGLQAQIKGRLIASTPQILIEPAGGRGIENADEILEHLRSHDSVSVQKVVTGIAWAADRSGERGRPVRIRSFERDSEPAADPSFGRRLEAEADVENPIHLARDFAGAMNLFPGDPIVIVAPRQRLTPFGPVPVFSTYTVATLLPSTLEDDAPDARLPFDEASRLFGTGGLPTAIEIYTSLDRAAIIREELTQRPWPVIIRDWSDLNKPLFLALRLEKIVMFATISLIIFVAALNLVSSVAMIIVEKRPQVGVLRTLGATEGSILQLYLGLGLLIGLVGTFLGNLFGLGIAWAADHFGLIPLPREVYAIGHLPFSIELSEVLAVNAIAVILSILATWYPARLAAKLDPVTAIHGP
ncbi:MAG TPA: FtsX-like permease family protein [Thermoanaerobaculia bacterium]|nr:FtsX-like permease family protein [Thermoanaerobaculia bacterium]